jgi:hypothetical protein
MGISENKLVNRPVWGRSHDQLKNIIWKKVSQGRKPQIPPKKKGKFGVEKRRSLGENTPHPIPVSKVPNQFHGNYGGRGNKGGEPIDKLDLAFKKHDTGYHFTPSGKHRAKHDKALIKASNKISKDKTVGFKVRLKAELASLYFRHKLKTQGVKEGDNAAMWYWQKHHRATNVVPLTHKNDEPPVLPANYLSDPEHLKKAKRKIWDSNYGAWKARSAEKRTNKKLGESVEKSEAYYKAITNFRSGFYGTPDDPHRGALHRTAFWDAYHGKPTMKHVPGSVAAAHAQAGHDAGKSKEQPTNKLEESKDLIGKKTASIEDIAVKYRLCINKVEAQIAKGVRVEREHTNSDAEAHEIARDHIHEFPDYYDRLDKMEKKAKKDMKENTSWTTHWLYHNGKVLMGVRGHKDASEKTIKQKAIDMNAKTPLHQPDMNPGDVHNAIRRSIIKVQEDAKARAYDVHLKGRHIDTVWFTGYDAEEARKSLINRDGYHPNIKVIDRDEESPYTHPREPAKSRVQKVREDAPVNSVGAGNIAGMPDADTADKTVVRKSTMHRRKKFAGKQVFVVDPTTYHNAHWGKRKYEHYEKYLEGCDIADEIRTFGRTNWAEPIIIQNDQTGAMIYLKYGSK